MVIKAPIKHQFIVSGLCVYSRKKIHTRTHVHIHTNTHTCTDTRTHTRTHAYLQTHRQPDRHTYAHRHIHRGPQVGAAACLYVCQVYLFHSPALLICVRLINFLFHTTACSPCLFHTLASVSLVRRSRSTLLPMSVLFTVPVSHSCPCQSCSPVPQSCSPFPFHTLAHVSFVRLSCSTLLPMSALFAASCSALLLLLMTVLSSVPAPHSCPCRSRSPLPVLHSVSLGRRFLFYILTLANDSLVFRSCSTLLPMTVRSLLPVLYSLSVLVAAFCSTLSVLFTVPVWHSNMSVLFAAFCSILFPVSVLFATSCSTLCQSFWPFLFHTFDHVTPAYRFPFYTISVLFAASRSTLCQSCFTVPISHLSMLVLFAASCSILLPMSVLFAVSCCTL